MIHEFEKYPELAEQMQEYASFGKFRDWQKFTDVLNETLRSLAEPSLYNSENVKQKTKLIRGKR